MNIGKKIEQQVALPGDTETQRSQKTLAVIGESKHQYDLWGDTVNIASRMESHGEAGKVHISNSTYELLSDDFECVSRGRVAVKGKGEMETWYLVGRRSRAEVVEMDS